MCESCNLPAVWSGTKFRTFCSHECAHKPGCSTINKMKNTNIERYGVSCYLGTKENEERIKQKYGGMGLGSSIIKDRIEKTNLEKYGCVNVFGAEEIKDKIKDTNLERYGETSYCYSLVSEYHRGKLEDIDYLRSVVEDDLPYSGHAEKLGINLNTLLKHIRKNGFKVSRKPFSILEIIIRDELLKHNIDHLTNDRTILNGMELDIFIPKAKLAIELNGLYWHAEDKENTLEKYIQCKKLGIDLLVFFEDEIYDKLPIIISMIKHLLH